MLHQISCPNVRRHEVLLSSLNFSADSWLVNNVKTCFFDFLIFFFFDPKYRRYIQYATLHNKLWRNSFLKSSVLTWVTLRVLGSTFCFIMRSNTSLWMADPCRHQASGACLLFSGFSVPCTSEKPKTTKKLLRNVTQSLGTSRKNASFLRNQKKVRINW